MIYEILLPAIAVIVVVGIARHKLRHEFIVAEGFTGLLYHQGKFAESLTPGRHVRWGRHFTVAPIDLRRSLMTIAGQDLLTADSVSLKLSLVVGYLVADPVRATHESQNWMGDLYHVAQLALRTVVNAVPVESLLSQRLEIGGQLLARVQPEAAKLGVTVHTVEVKDVMFPAELKRAFADVLKAKQEGQAALERARGESAALRNLANAARLMEGNPALLNLRLIQSVTAAQAGGNTLVLGLPGGFVPLKNGGPRPSGESAPEPSSS